MLNIPLFKTASGQKTFYYRTVTVADPDLELREGRGGGGWVGGLDLLAMAAIFPPVISSFFIQNKGGGRNPRAPPLDPPLS